MKKKIVCGMLCAAMSLSLLAGCGGGSDEGGKDAKKDGDAIKLGVLVYKYDDTYISTVRSAIEKYAKEADVEIKLDMQDGQGDQSKQNDQLDVLISKGVDALLINAVDTGSAQGLADKAKAADIPAVFFNREPAKEVVESCEGIFVGTTASEAGVMQGDMLADMYEADKEAIDKNGDGKIQYIVFKGEPGNPEAEARTEYAAEYSCVQFPWCLHRHLPQSKAPGEHADPLRLSRIGRTDHFINNVLKTALCYRCTSCLCDGRCDVCSRIYEGTQ